MCQRFKAPRCRAGMSSSPSSLRAPGRYEPLAPTTSCVAVCAKPRLDHRAQAGMSRSSSPLWRWADLSRCLPSHLARALGQTGRWAAPYWLPRCTDQIIGPGAVRLLAPHSRASVPAATAGPARHTGRLCLVVRTAGYRAAVGPGSPAARARRHDRAANLSPACRGRLGLDIAAAGHHPSHGTPGRPAGRPKARHSRYSPDATQLGMGSGNSPLAYQVESRTRRLRYDLVPAGRARLASRSPPSAIRTIY
jgi:hypothetical protein